MKRRHFLRLIFLGLLGLTTPRHVYSPCISKPPDISVGVDFGGPPFHSNCLCVIVIVDTKTGVIKIADREIGNVFEFKGVRPYDLNRARHEGAGGTAPLCYRGTE